MISLWPMRQQNSQILLTALTEGTSLVSRLKLDKELLPVSCLSCCATYEKIFGIVGIRSMSNTWDRTLLYCSFNPRKNCMAQSSRFRWAMVVRTEQVHLTMHEHTGSGLKFVISSHMARSFVKYSVTEREPCLMDTASCWRSETLRRSPCA